MSTTDLNTNNSSQTLFRFATMRNPELSDPKNKERRFIFRDYNTQKGKIDPRVEAGESLQKIFQNPSTISGFNILTEEDLKSGYAPFYEYAVWVARNKATATKEEFDKKIKACKTANGIPTVDYRIWDNLVYQVVTQKEFYAKELIMQILHLYHILSVYDFTEEAYQDVVKAKVVLPKELFKVQNVTSSSSNSNSQSTSKSVMYDEKSMKVAEAGMQLQQNQNLSVTLKKLQDNYKKQYDASYKKSYADYQEKVLPLQKQFRKETSVANNKKQILENRINYLTQLSVADPEKFYANSELDMELHRIKDEILNIPSSEVEIPEFNFSFDPEINLSALERTLKDDEKLVLYRIFGTSNISEALSGISTYDGINAAIIQNNQSLQQTVLNNTVLNQQTYANVGGIVVPVTNTSANNSIIPFFARTWMPWMSSEHVMMIRTDINDPRNIISGNYTLKGHDQQIIASASTAEVYGAPNVTTLFNGNIRISNAIVSKYEILTLEGEVMLDDGVVYIMKATLTVTSNNSFKFEGPGTFTAKDRGSSSTGTGTTSSTTESSGDIFIPSGFGMKNIGVADYLKVEQSLQGYVEGEVAHIENVMARERREKATKKTSKSEITTIESSDSEKEQLRDTSSTERFEMQNEIAKAMQQTKDAHAEAHVDGSYGGINFGVSGGFATHNSKEENTKQAMTQAKEITQKATDKIVTKVHKERTEKMIEEFEETNIHEFDNRKGDKHVVGVYRWIDKVFKNQIYNYGKRMMFEFMIPEPARIHRLGMQVKGTTSGQLVKPVDPRESDVQKLENYSSLQNETTLKFWLSKYNVEVEEKPMEEFSISKSFSGRDSNFMGQDDGKIQIVNGNGEVELPEGYILKEVSYVFNTYPHGFYGAHQAFITIAGTGVTWINTINSTQVSGTTDSLNIKGKLEFSFATGESPIIQGSLKLNLKLSQEYKNAWLQKTFNKIIEAYEKAKAKYEQDLAAIQAQGVEIKGSNPGFYRQIENTILRRNCISYMINQDPLAALTFGKDKYYRTNSSEESFLNTEIKLDSTLDKYTAFVKFMEQAFEWEIMSYYFYPYYWGNRNNWDKMYQFDDNDATFRAFMQSGMARVIVTVRPGFEEAVRHFMSTGQIWNGGEVPVIDDPMFLSIVDEMRKTEGEKYGKAWASRVPTALTILQAQSIGLNVTKALPFDDNLSDYEDPTKVPQSSQIVPTDAQMGGSDEQKTGSISGNIEGLDGLLPEIMLKNKDKSPVDFTNPNEKGDFWMENIPVGKYELCLDENDDFDNQYSVIEGKVTRVVEVKEASATTVHLVVKKI